MNCYRGLKTMEFRHDNIKLQGMLTHITLALMKIHVEQLCKWLQGNEVWALAVVDSALVNQDTPLPSPLQALLDEYDDVFQEPKTLSPHRAFDHAIPLEPSAPPPNAYPCRYSLLRKDEIERRVAEMLVAGLITKTLSPFAALCEKGRRFCVDYHRLNDITVKNKFPMPMVDELLDELAGERYFSKLHLHAGYHQICACPDDGAKPVFKTHHGHFQFRVMPFGLKNAPATFQCLMNSLFAPKFVIVFLDDILTYIASFDEHLGHLSQVFDTAPTSTLRQVLQMLVRAALHPLPRPRHLSCRRRH